MVSVDDTYENALITWSPKLFLIGGVLAVGHAMLMGIKAFTEAATPPEVFAPTGQLFVFGGLLGVYFTLGDRTPKLARAGSVCVALGIVGFSAITVGNLAEFGGIDPPAWFTVFTLLGIIGMVPGFLAVGIASLRADAHSRTVGLLLLAPPLMFLASITSVLIHGPSPITGLIIGSGLALTYLAMGYSLKPAFTPTPAGTAVAESTAS